MEKPNLTRKNFGGAALPLYVWIIIASVALVFLVIAICSCLRKRKSKRGASQFIQSPHVYATQPPNASPGIPYQSYLPANSTTYSPSTVSYRSSIPYPPPSGSTAAFNNTPNSVSYTSSHVYSTSPPTAASTVESGTSVVGPDNFYAVGSTAPNIPIN